MFEFERQKASEGWAMEQWSEDLMMSSYINCKLRQILRQFL
jgi:hypothetical protein